MKLATIGRSLLWLLATMLWGHSVSLAQDRTITGKVTDDKGQGIPSVTIVLKGTSRSVTTDVNGNYTFTNAPANGGVLVFSSVGYGSREVAAGSAGAVTLQTEAGNLSEVVVIGYGTASKRDLTGSITKVEGREVADKPNSNPVASLQGKVAGLSIVNNGTPGGEPDIRIRGTSSIGSVKPLYLVDGIFNDNIDFLNPNDIESIEVLKDPSSLAIFGVRGATGVIAITTKRARAGQTIINFSTNTGFKKLVDKIKLANADEFRTLFAEERLNDQNTTVPYDFTGLNSNTDWIDAVTRTGTFSTNNLSVSTGTDRNKFNFNVGFIQDQGIIRHEELKRLTASLADEVKLTNNIKVGVNLAVSRQRNPYGATWVLDAARKVIPLQSAETKIFRVRNPYGSDSMEIPLYAGLDVGLQSAGVINPLVTLENEWDKTKAIEYRTVGSVYGDITFLRKFNFRSTVYADISNVNSRVYNGLYYYYDPKTNLPQAARNQTSVSEGDQTYRKFQQDHILTYKNNFGDHGLTLTGGFTTYFFSTFQRYAGATQDPAGRPIPNDERFWYISNGFNLPTSVNASSFQSESSTVSYLARALYNYKSKYFFNASFRNDASSKIPAKSRNQRFWALGAAWDMTKESFMANQNTFDYVKIKGSMGVLGNQNSADRDGNQLAYPFYPSLNTGASAVFGTNFVNAAVEDYQASPDLKWETVHAKEIGFEANLLKNALHIEYNYFNRTTKNLMTFVDRASLGIKPILINGGSLRNWGHELMAAWNKPLTKDFSINLSGNITFLKNKVVSLSEELPTGVLSRTFQNNGSAESRTKPGYAIGSFYGYVVEGIYQSYAEILKSPPAGGVGAYRPGDFKFKDVNGDGLISTEDRTFIGNPTPDFSYGASVAATWKGLTLDVDVNGVYGNEVFRTWGSLESPFQRVNYSGDKIERWHGAGTSNWVPLVSQGDRYNYNGSTYNIEDGSYLRIRNVQLSYNFAQKLIRSARIKNLRVYANVQNLKTFKNNYGYTPEFGGGATAFGYDNAGGAIPMVTTFGLNVTF